uniref:PI-PLC X domain-containing protein 3-like n=1 Tax=Crassostrea virginica TaxID=6565 RepID=A0A8B8BCH0_CRAVI|nr:PI-PLC X domain-containing protein 3-like [Crassostrea virginica]
MDTSLSPLGIENYYRPGKWRKDWMSCLPAPLQKVPINKLAIPGSHNSITYSLDPDSQVTPDQPWMVQNLAYMFGVIVRYIIYYWSVTQHLTAEQQLNAGIRYFDLRVSRHNSSGKVYFSHGLYGTDVISCLESINIFLDVHKKEFVILDFNHFHGMELDHHKSLIMNMKSIFGNKICSSTNINNVTLQKLWEKGLQVIILYHYEHVFNDHHDVLWHESYISSPWAETADISQLLSFLDKHKRTSYDQERFFCWQGILTPSAQTIILNPFGSLKEVLAAELAPSFVTWVKNCKSVNCKHGIFIADFVEMAEFIPTVIELNY